MADKEEGKPEITELSVDFPVRPGAGKGTPTGSIEDAPVSTSSPDSKPVGTSKTGTGSATKPTTEPTSEAPSGRAETPPSTSTPAPSTKTGTAPTAGMSLENALSKKVKDSPGAKVTQQPSSSFNPNRRHIEQEVDGVPTQVEIPGLRGRSFGGRRKENLYNEKDPSSYTEHSNLYKTGDPNKSRSQNRKLKKAGKQKYRDEKAVAKKTTKSGNKAVAAGGKAASVSGKVRLLTNKKVLLAIAFFISALIFIVAGFFATVSNLFTASETASRMGRYNNSSAIEFTLDSQLVWYLNNDRLGVDDWEIEGEISPMANMFAYWEEAYVRQEEHASTDSRVVKSVKDQFISFISDRYNLDEKKLRNRQGDIINVAEGSSYGGISWTIEADSIFDKPLTINTDETLRSVQLFRSSLVPFSEISRWQRNTTMLRLLGIDTRSLFEVNEIKTPAYTENEDVEKEEDVEIIREEYIKTTENFLKRFENYTYKATEAAIACIYAVPPEVDILDLNGEPTGETRIKSHEEECEDQFDIRVSDTDKDDDTEDLIGEAADLRSQFIEKSFEIKFNEPAEGDQPLDIQEKTLELAKIEREYVNKVLSEVYMTSIRDFLYYWRSSPGHGQTVLSAYESAKTSGALAHANFQYTYQTYMIYSDTIATIVHEINRQGAHNTEKQIADFYFNEFSASPVWELYRGEEEGGDDSGGDKNKSLEPVCIDPESSTWEPKPTELEGSTGTSIYDNVSSDEYICPERKFQDMSLADTDNEDILEVIKTGWPAAPVDINGEPDESFWKDGIPPEGVDEEDTSDVDGAYELAKVLLDSNATPLISGPHAYESYLAGELSLGYVLSSSRSSLAGDKVRDGGIGGAKMQTGGNVTSPGENEESEDQHRLEKVYKLYDFQAYGSSNVVGSYMDLYTEPNKFWVQSFCGSNEYKESFNKWLYDAKNPPTKNLYEPLNTGEPCSLIIAAAYIGSFGFNDKTTHKVEVKEVKEVDEPDISTVVEIFTPEEPECDPLTDTYRCQDVEPDICDPNTDAYRCQDVGVSDSEDDDPTEDQTEDQGGE